MKGKRNKPLNIALKLRHEHGQLNIQDHPGANIISKVSAASTCHLLLWEGTQEICGNHNELTWLLAGFLLSLHNVVRNP